MTYSGRLAFITLAGFLAFGTAWSQQGPTVTLQPPTLGDAERAYRDAQQEWLNADPNLAADLFKGNPREMHTRIARTAALRDQMMEKKAIYLDQMAKHFNETRTRLSNTKDVQLPVSELRKNLESEQARILGEMDRLDVLIHDLPQDDLYALVARELNAERTQLVNLQVSLAQQIRTVGSIGDLQDASSKMDAANPLEKKLAAISLLWEQERDNANVQREHWKTLYAAMNRAVDGGKSPAPSTPAGNPPPPSKSEPVKPGGVAPGKPGTVKPGDLKGSWLYQSSPNGWTGFGEPVQVALELHYDGKGLVGSYVARLPGRKDTRDLYLMLSGEEVKPGKAVLQWISSVPSANGEIVVQLGSDRRVLLERTKSTDTYVPGGMEVLLPR